MLVNNVGVHSKKETSKISPFSLGISKHIFVWPDENNFNGRSYIFHDFHE
jgi:hypothetical protein